MMKRFGDRAALSRESVQRSGPGRHLPLEVDIGSLSASLWTGVRCGSEPSLWSRSRSRRSRRRPICARPAPTRRSSARPPTPRAWTSNSPLPRSASGAKGTHTLFQRQTSVQVNGRRTLRPAAVNGCDVPPRASQGFVRALDENLWSTLQVSPHHTCPPWTMIVDLSGYCSSSLPKGGEHAG